MSEAEQEKEVEKRRDAAVRRALATPPKPNRELAKPKAAKPKKEKPAK